MPRLHTRDRKIIREITTRKRRTFLISLAIFFSVAGIIALFSLGDILIRQLEKEINNDDIAMLNTLVIAPHGAQLDNVGYIELLKRETQATTIQGSLRATIRWRSNVNKPYTTATINGYDTDFEAISIEPPRLLEGRYPNLGEVAIEQRFAARHGLKIGDRLYFITPDEQELAYQVSGILFHVYNLSPNTGIYANLQDANLLSGTNGYNIISARFANYAIARRMADDFSEVLLHQTNYFPIQFQLQDPNFNPLNEGAKRVANTLNFLAILSLLIAAFSVINITRKIVGEQKQQIGTLKALGASRLELIYMYVGIAFGYGIIGVIPGLMVGIPLGYYLADYLAPEVNTILTRFEYSVSAILVGIALGLIVPVFAAMIPTIMGTRITILEAITDKGIDYDYNNSLIAALIRHLPLPIDIKMALHNVNKKKMRLALTVAALTLAVGSYIAILTVFNAIGEQVGSKLSALSASHVRSVDLPQEIFAPNQPLVPYTNNFNTNQVFVGPFNNIGLPILLATYAINNNEVVVSQAYAEQTDVTTGDVIQLSIGSNTIWFRVVGIAPSQEVQLWINNELVTDTGELEQIGDRQISLEELATATLNDASTFDFLALLRGFRLNLQTYRILLSVIAALIGVVGGLGLATTLSLSVLERQREIGIMRSVGASSWVIVNQFVIEGVSVGIISWFVGLPLSVLLADQLIEIMGLQEQFTTTLRFDAALTGFIAVIILSTISSIWPAQNAASQTVSDILRYH